MICLVHPWFLDDADLRLVHQQRVEERMGQLRAIVGQVGAAVRTGSLVVGAVIGTATGTVAGIAGGAPSGLLAFGLSMAAAPLLREGVKGAIRLALRRARAAPLSGKQSLR